MAFGLGNIISAIGNPGAYWGTNNTIGEALNDVTGQTSSAKRQFKNQMALQHDAQKFAKWQMENAHQTEVQDLINAGLNPILSANGGASAGVTEGSASTGQASADPIAMAGQIIGMMNTSKQTKATIENLHNLNEQIQNEITNSTNKTEAEIGKIRAETEALKWNTGKDKENNVNTNTPYPIKIINSAKQSAKREKEEWKEKSKQKGWSGWKYKARNWIFNNH